jgi:hypothetical protein
MGKSREALCCPTLQQANKLYQKCILSAPSLRVEIVNRKASANWRQPMIARMPLFLFIFIDNDINKHWSFKEFGSNALA